MRAVTQLYGAPLPVHVTAFSVSFFRPAFTRSSRFIGGWNSGSFAPLTLFLFVLTDDRRMPVSFVVFTDRVLGARLLAFDYGGLN